MRNIKIAGLCLVAVFALAAATASSALAKDKEKPPKPGLYLLNKGVAVTSPATANLEIDTNYCSLSETGTIGSGKSSDKGAFSGPSISCVESGYGLTGDVTSVDLKGKAGESEGTAGYKGDLVLTVPGGCKYKVTKFGTALLFEENKGATVEFGPMAGKVTGSPGTCSKTFETFFSAVIGPAPEEAFETELIS